MPFIRIEIHVYDWTQEIDMGGNGVLRDGWIYLLDYLLFLSKTAPNNPLP